MTLYDLYLKHPKISIDSRKIELDCLFFALKGKDKNGNNFAQHALEEGAAFAIIDEASKKNSDRFILVPNALKALQELATYHRKKLKTIIICVAGSNGKTTTKDLITKVLNSKIKTFGTIENFNNHIGVPLSILKLDNSYELAVIEIGADHIGENLFLCEIVMPNFGVVTNCGKDHLAGFANEGGVIQSCKEVFSYLKKTDGIAFVNEDDKTLMEISDGLKRIFYGGETQKIVTRFPFIKVETIAGVIESSLYGSFQGWNISCAYTIGKYFGIDEDSIKKAIGTYIPSNNRSQLVKWGNNILLLDAYNANPSSMKAMIEDFSEDPVKNKITVLGDMLELGKHSFAEHEQIIELLKHSHVGQVVLVGQEFKKHVTEFIHFESSKELKAWLLSNRFDECFFLVKGSRAIALEKAFF